jgi:hypothetical protein
MADTGSKGRKPIKPDDLVESSRPDPAETGATIRFVGFLGKSTQAGFWRLYSSPYLTDYIEIADSDILTSQQIDSQISPMGGSVISVRADARVVQKRVVTTEARNAFLSGGIAYRYLRSSAPQVPFDRRASRMAIGGGGGGLGEHTDGAWGCWLSHIFACASHDPDNTICTAQTENPGTADSCGMCSTEYMCGVVFR